MLMFGVVQIIMSQIPDFHSMVLVSVIAAVMSFCYSSIGFGLGFAQVIGTTTFIFLFPLMFLEGAWRFVSKLKTL